MNPLGIDEEKEKNTSPAHLFTLLVLINVENGARNNRRYFRIVHQGDNSVPKRAWVPKRISEGSQKYDVCCHPIKMHKLKQEKKCRSGRDDPIPFLIPFPKCVRSEEHTSEL